MNAIKKLFRMNMITSIVFLVIGVFLVFRTEGTINLISSIIGVILLFNGGFSLIRYFKNETERPYNVEMIYGLVAILAGFILILNPATVASILPFVLGIYFTITGITKLKYAWDIKNYGRENPVFMFILSILTTMCGILFIVNPFEGAIAITQAIGIFMMIYACLDIINYFVLRRDIKVIENIFRR